MAAPAAACRTRLLGCPSKAGEDQFAQLDGATIEVRTTSGRRYPADIVILAMGVRPDTALAKAEGLAIGERREIRVDEHMRTSASTRL